MIHFALVCYFFCFALITSLRTPLFAPPLLALLAQVPKEQLAFLLADLVRESADMLLRGEQELTLNTDWLLYLSTRFPREYGQPHCTAAHTTRYHSC